MFPFSFDPVAMVRLVLLAACVAAAVWFANLLIEHGKDEIRAEYAEAERQKQIAINQSAEEAERARGPAAMPGAPKRLQTNWCRDCGVTK